MKSGFVPGRYPGTIPENFVLVSTDDAIARALSSLAESQGLKILRRGSLLGVHAEPWHATACAYVIHLSDWHQRNSIYTPERGPDAVPLVFISSDVRAPVGGRSNRERFGSYFELPRQQEALMQHLGELSRAASTNIRAWPQS